MINLTIKIDKLLKLLAVLISVFYGFFTVFTLQRLFLSESGDIAAYVDFFSDIDIFTTFNEYSLIGDGIFRVSVIFLGNLLNIEIIDVLSLLAFLMATAVFSTFLMSIRSTNYLIYLSPIFFMVFFSPIVINLFASSIRSGIAFTILLIAFVHFKGILKYTLLVLSAIIHISMVPIITFYFLYFVLRKIKSRSIFLFPLICLFLFSFLMTIFAYYLRFNVTEINTSFFYNLFIFCLGILILFTNKKVVNDVYGFISIGLFMLYFLGIFFDISFIRYIGNAIVLYFLFLIFKGRLGTIQVFTLGYLPFFLLNVFYTMSNVS